MSGIYVVKRDARTEPLQMEKIHKVTAYAVEGLNASQEELEDAVRLMFYDGIQTTDIHEALIKAAASLTDFGRADYTFVAARLLLQKIYKEITGGSVMYPSLYNYVRTGIKEERLNPDLLVGFDYQALERAIHPERDLQFDLLGLTTLYDRYFIREQAKAGAVPRVIEMPQHFWMRVAMGLALKEKDRTARAVEFYHVLSSFDYVSSTPTLFNSGTLHSQMSSCYLNTISDSIEGIFGIITENAHLSKWAGGIGSDWTYVRPDGEIIKGTNGKSSGPIPYLKIFNDTAVAVNQGGKRQGSFAAYLEPWHPDFLKFIELKKQSGDERLRAHDIFPAVWAPALFFKRVRENGVWTFFSPREYPELHKLYGTAFNERYEHLEKHGHVWAQMNALDVWKKWLTMLFETGAPWVTFKDECNLRSPQDHVGVVHNSNLCTEITLNTSDTETAVCNLGSVNVGRHMKNGELDLVKFRKTVRSAVRMLDNVIDLNWYPVEKARNSNMKHRPVGFGMMGYQDAMVQAGIAFDSEAHLQWADELFEIWSYLAIEASSDLAEERGKYQSYTGSKWDRGILPIDTAREQTCKFDWTPLREKIKRQGMRNSNVMAIAPTATISNIIYASPCIEPIFERVTVKDNLAGGFKVIPSVFRYGRPDLVKTVWELDMKWVILAAARRQKWIDQAQSVNLWAKTGTKGSQLSEWYLLAEEKGLKTTYYLRPQRAKAGDTTQAMTAADVGAKEGYSVEEAIACSLDNPEACEACQ